MRTPTAPHPLRLLPLALALYLLLLGEAALLGGTQALFPCMAAIPVVLGLMALWRCRRDLLEHPLLWKGVVLAFYLVAVVGAVFFCCEHAGEMNGVPGIIALLSFFVPRQNRAGR